MVRMETCHGMKYGSGTAELAEVSLGDFSDIYGSEWNPLPVSKRPQSCHLRGQYNMEKF